LGKIQVSKGCSEEFSLFSYYNLPQLPTFGESEKNVEMYGKLLLLKFNIGEELKMKTITKNHT
jgi:hypothetical protein